MPDEHVIAALVVLVGLLGSLGYVLLKTEARRSGAGGAFLAGGIPIAPHIEPDQYRALLILVLGDRARAERLIGEELRKAPGLGRPAAIRRAIARRREDLAPSR